MKHVEINEKCYITRNKFKNSVSTLQTGTMSLNLEKASTIAWIDDMCSNVAEEDSSPAVTKSLPDEQIPRDKRRLKVEGICI